MPAPIEFVGIPSKNAEGQFAFRVGRETFLRITGYSPSEYDRDPADATMFLLFPDQLIPHNLKDLRLKVTFGVESL